MLKILSEWTEKRHDGHGTRSFCMAECDCGDVSRYEKSNVVRGNSTRCKSCSTENRSRKLTRHGAASPVCSDELKRKAYVIYKGMKSRCKNPKNARYNSYGGRGISISDEWASGFDRFISDMGLPPTSSHSIDRIDNDLGYCKENCRWATATEQARNKRNNRVLEIDGVSMAMSEWSERSGESRGSIAARLDRGWSNRDAVFGRRGKYLVSGVVYSSLREIADFFGMSISGVSSRITSEKWEDWIKM